MPAQASGDGQHVRGLIARSKGAPMGSSPVVVPHPRPGEAVEAALIIENADRMGTRG